MLLNQPNTIREAPWKMLRVATQQEHLLANVLSRVTLAVDAPPCDLRVLCGGAELTACAHVAEFWFHK